MCLISKLKSAFRSKLHRNLKDSNRSLDSAEAMYDRANDPYYMGSAPADVLYTQDYFQNRRPASQAPPTQHWTRSREVNYSEYWADVDSSHWADFDGTHVTAAYEGIASRGEEFGGTDSIVSETPASNDFLFHPEGYQTGHVEDALRQKRASAVSYDKYTAVDPSELDRAARPISWVLPVEESFFVFEYFLAQEKSRPRTSDRETGAFRDESPPCPNRKQTMRGVTLARLEGRRRN